MVKLRLGASRAFPAGLAQKLKKALEEEERFPAFPLIDPLKRFAPQDFGWAEESSENWGTEQVLPRISVPGLIDPVFPEAIPAPNRDDPIDTASLLRRIRSLKEALDNLPRHARRFARWKAKSEIAQKPGEPQSPAAFPRSVPAPRQESTCTRSATSM